MELLGSFNETGHGKTTEAQLDGKGGSWKSWWSFRPLINWKRKRQYHDNGGCDVPWRVMFTIQLKFAFTSAR